MGRPGSNKVGKVTRKVELRTRRIRLTPALCRQQLTEVVIENFEAANKLLRSARHGGEYGPATLAQARKQRVICYNELRRRGVPREDLDYEPDQTEVAEPSETLSSGAPELSAGGGADPGVRPAP